jgi:hypothetical protein
MSENSIQPMIRDLVFPSCIPPLGATGSRTFVPWEVSDGSSHASSLAGVPDDVFGTHTLDQG